MNPWRHRHDACRPACPAPWRRHSTLPLVSKRFAELCHSPELLRTVSVRLMEPRLLPKLRALCRWLVRRAAASVEVLEIALARVDGQKPSLVGEDGAEAVAALAAAAAACGAAGTLFELQLELDAVDVPVRLGAWAAALEDLHELKVETYSALHLVCSLTAPRLEVLVRPGAGARQQPGAAVCPACLRGSTCRPFLQVAAEVAAGVAAEVVAGGWHPTEAPAHPNGLLQELHGEPVHLPPGVALPASITRLVLGPEGDVDDLPDRLSPQVRNGVHGGSCCAVCCSACAVLAALNGASATGEAVLAKGSPPTAAWRRWRSSPASRSSTCEGVAWPTFLRT